MPDPEPMSLGIGHPAPHRQAASPLLLLFALFGAPAVWIGELLFGFATTSYTCDMHQSRAALPSEPGWVSWAISVVNGVALLIAVLALVAGALLLRRTNAEHRTRSGEPVDAGEGRTRVLAIWAIAGSIIFLVALITNTFSLSLVPICRP